MKDRKIKILITGGALTPNKGAGAMTYVAIDLAHDIAGRLHREVEVILLSDFAAEDKKFIDSSRVTIVDEKVGLFGKPIMNKVLEFLCSFLCRIPVVGGTFVRFGNLDVYRDSDILLDVSGDACGDGYKRGVLVVMRRLIIAENMRLPVVILPQSLGPFSKLLSRILVKKYFKSFEKIYYREDITGSILKELKLRNTEFSPDLAFYLKPDKSKDMSVITDGNLPVIGISVSNSITRYAVGQESDGLQRRYIESFVKFVTKYSSKYRIVFINHVLGPGKRNDDREMAKTICSRLKNKDNIYNLTEDLDSKMLKGTISQCQYFIGCRMHSNIASLSSSVPTIAISYSHKYKGIMDLYGLGDYVIPFRELELDVLEAKFREIVKNEKSVREKLGKGNDKIDSHYAKFQESIVSCVADSIN